jgi:hypothetical protein
MIDYAAIGFACYGALATASAIAAAARNTNLSRELIVWKERCDGHRSQIDAYERDIADTDALYTGYLAAKAAYEKIIANPPGAPEKIPRDEARMILRAVSIACQHGLLDEVGPDVGRDQLDRAIARLRIVADRMPAPVAPIEAQPHAE